MIVKTDDSEIENYLADSANFKGFCDSVLFPETEEEVIQILSEANIKKQKVTVSGNGTGLTGARVPEGGIVVATDKLNKIIKVDSKKKHAVVQPGVLLKDFQKEVRSMELYYPPDPTEQDCFIGATVATNASGAKSFKYGPTRNFVKALRIVLPNGELLVLDRGIQFSKNNLLSLNSEGGNKIEITLPNYSMPKTKNSAGYYSKNGMDLIDLFVGSEGTLGIITEIKLRLLPAPDHILSAVLFFDKETDAFNFADEARERSISNRKDNLEDIDARGIEFFDLGSLKFIREEFPQIPTEVNSAIWIEQETNSENEELLTNEWLVLAQNYNADIENSWFASDITELRNFTNFRHAVSAKVTEFISNKGIRKIGTDTALPVKHFREYYQKMISKVNAHGIKYICYGHIGDCHLHMNMMPENEPELNQCKVIYSELCRMAVNFSGTISAEHGVGKLKRDHLLMMYGEEIIMQMAKVKKSIDPNSILGIGNMFDPKYLDL